MPKVSKIPPPDPDDGWQRVAARLQREFRQRGLSNAQVARDVHMAPATLQKLLEGGGIARPDRAAALSIYLGWAGDGIDRIRAGQEPDLDPDPEPEPIQMAASGADLEQLRVADPEAYAALEQMARIALDRARRRDQG